VNVYCIQLQLEVCVYECVLYTVIVRNVCVNVYCIQV
jgi:hypothetical protein